MHVNASPSDMGVRSVWVVEDVTVLWSMTNG